MGLRQVPRAAPWLCPCPCSAVPARLFCTRAQAGVEAVQTTWSERPSGCCAHRRSHLPPVLPCSIPLGP